MKNIQKSLKRKRTEYVVGLINQFKQSEEEQSASNCYHYVKIEHESSGLSIFQKSLPEDERRILSENQHVWFTCFESFSTFQIFLQNQEITFNG
jgi:hypothetical protein